MGVVAVRMAHEDSAARPRDSTTTIIEKARAAREAAAAQVAASMQDLAEVRMAHDDSAARPRDSTTAILEKARAAREAAAAQVAASRQDLAESSIKKADVADEVQLILSKALESDSTTAKQDVRDARAHQAAPSLSVQTAQVDELRRASQADADSVSTGLLRDRARKARELAAAQLAAMEMAEEADKALDEELQKRRTSLAEKRAKRLSQAQEVH